MIIGGLQKFSLIEYPGKLTAVLFTRGCNFRCPYCHNPELVIPEQYSGGIPLEEIYQFLEKRRGKLDAVCISGGEPTLHEDLIQIVETIRNIGFLIKLDTNGSNPDVIEKLIDKELVDYIAMDIKAPLDRYQTVRQHAVHSSQIRQSIDLIMRSIIDYEFRTTFVRSLLCREDILEIGRSIKGARCYYLQKFIPSKLCDPTFHAGDPYSDMEIREIVDELQKWVVRCGVR